MRPTLFLLALFPLTLSAQRFDFGIQGGIPMQTPLGRASRMPFALGPSLDVHLTSGLSLETGLLLSRFGERSDNYGFLYPENSVTLGLATTKGHAAEVPLLAKYRFRGTHSTWRPFLTAGPTIRHTSLVYDQLSNIVSGSSLTTVGLQGYHSSTGQWNVDPMGGAGVSFRTGRFRLEPEVRYSYWGASTTSPVRKNQVNFLLGFRF